jgi:hypothetical protein
MTNKDLFKGTTYDSLEKQVGGKTLPKYEKFSQRIL